MSPYSKEEGALSESKFHKVNCLVVGKRFHLGDGSLREDVARKLNNNLLLGEARLIGEISFRNEEIVGRKILALKISSKVIIVRCL